MKCSEVRTFLSQVFDREEPITSVSPADLEYWSVNGYVLKTTKEDYEKGINDVARLSQIYTQIDSEKSREEQTREALQQDVRKEHSFLFHLEGTQAKDELEERIQQETAAVSSEASELNQLEATVNDLIQKKSLIDRMVVYDGGYVSLTGLGTLVFNDLSVRSYRVADQEFPDFIAEIKATYAELRGIADKATSWAQWVKPQVPEIEDLDDSENGDNGNGDQGLSLLLSTGIGLAKLQGDTTEIARR